MAGSPTGVGRRRRRSSTARGRYEDRANDTGHPGMQSSQITLQISILLRDQRLHRDRHDRSTAPTCSRISTRFIVKHGVHVRAQADGGREARGVRWPQHHDQSGARPRGLLLLPRPLVWQHLSMEYRLRPRANSLRELRDAKERRSGAGPFEAALRGLAARSSRPRPIMRCGRSKHIGHPEDGRPVHRVLQGRHRGDDDLSPDRQGAAVAGLLCRVETAVASGEIRVEPFRPKPVARFRPVRIEKQEVLQERDAL